MTAFSKILPSVRYAESVRAGTVKRPRIAGLMGTASVLGLVSMVVTSTAAMAQETAAETVVVTGTRRSDVTALQSSTPIQVISNADIADASQSNLSMALQTSVPSFEFPQNNASSSVQLAPKSASLQGLGPDQVLILVDGIRYHLNSQVNVSSTAFGYGTQVVDIDTIPVAAIDRTEVLLGGASAQYGSDALAGVINFVLKKKDSGLDLTAQQSQYLYGGGGPSDKLWGGSTTTVTGSAGMALPNDGFVHVAFEGVYSTPEESPEAPDTRQWYYPTSARSVLEPSANSSQRYWFYGSGKYDKLGLMANAEQPITQNLAVYGFVEGGFRQNYGFGNFRRPEDDGTVRAIYPDGFQPLQLVTSTDYDGAIGLKYDAGDIGKFNLSAEHGSNRAILRVSNTDNASQGLASGTSGYSGATQDDETNLNLDYTRSLDVGFLPDALNVAAGLAYRYQRYEIAAGDALTWANGGQPILDGTNAGKPAALGSQSATGFQPADAGTFGRDVASGYIELEGDILPHFNLDIAGRSDHYSDFGWTNNVKVAARYDITPEFAIRGSASTGFRAPSIGQMEYAHTTGIFVNNVQYLQRIVRPDSAAGAALGAKPLQPENSTNYQAGFVFNGWNNSVLTVDAYDIHVGHRIVLSQSMTGTVVASELAAAGFPDLQGAQYFSNGISTRTAGFSVIAHKTVDFDTSTLLLSLGYDLNTTDITYVAPNPSQLPASVTPLSRQILGFIKSREPGNKLILGADYSWGAWTIAPKATRYGQYSYLDLSKSALDQIFSPQWVTDLAVKYRVNSDLTLSVGAYNLFNTYPDKQIAAERSPNVSEYPLTAPDGAFGTQYFVRIAASL